MTPNEWLVKVCEGVAPQLWRQVDALRAQKGGELPDWPEWCFLPFGGWYAITCMALEKERLAQDDAMLLQTLAVAGTWRVTQDIVRYDPTLYRHLVETPVTGNIPSTVLVRLPAWCVYIETPEGIDILGKACIGFWAMLENDANGLGDELRLFLFDGENVPLIPLVLQLGEWSVEDALAKPAYTDALREIFPVDQAQSTVKTLLTLPAVPKILSLLLYICTYGFPRSGLAPLEHPAYPKPKKTKRGWRLFPADKPAVRIVGESIGKRLRAAESQRPQEREHGFRASLRPHIRRGHWHGFWHGPKKGERHLKLQWLPPIPVAMVDED